MSEFKEFFFNEKPIEEGYSEYIFITKYSTICENDWCTNLTIDNPNGFISSLLYLDYNRKSLEKRLNFFFDKNFLDSDDVLITDDIDFMHFSKANKIKNRLNPVNFANYYNYIILDSNEKYNAQDLLNAYSTFLLNNNNIQNKSILIKEANTNLTQHLLKKIEKHSTETTSLLNFNEHPIIQKPGFIYSTNSKKHPSMLIDKYIGKNGKLFLSNLYESIIFDKVKNKPHLI